MHQPHALPHRTCWRRAWTAITITSLIVLCGGLSLAMWRSLDRKVPSQPPAKSLLEDLPVIQKPPALSAGEARLPDDAEVIGVSVGGRHRAYAVEAFVPPERHVINDLVGGAPLTVTYCDMTNCVQVFTDPRGEQALAIAAGGWIGRKVKGHLEGSMLLRVGSTWYRQDTGEAVAPEAASSLPYTKTEFARTTWKQWREAYPKTDAYIGELPHGPARLLNN